MLKVPVLTVLCAASGYAQCPLQFIKVDPMVKDSWGRVGRTAASGNHAKYLPPDFVVRVQNVSGKDIRGLKLQAAYFDATEDLTSLPVAWNWQKGIKAAAEKSMSWPNELYTDKAFVGWIVVPIKILYEDGSTWAAADSTPACFGEYWRNKKHPRLTAIPQELLKAVP